MKRRYFQILLSLIILIHFNEFFLEKHNFKNVKINLKFFSLVNFFEILI